jgi:hypothetical protein
VDGHALAATVATRPGVDRRAIQIVETGYGRVREVLHFVASTDLTADLDWPNVTQVAWIERSWCKHGQPKRARHYGITSLPPQDDRLLALKLGHWAIENRLHRPKDVTFGEDASLIPSSAESPTIEAEKKRPSLLTCHGTCLTKRSFQQIRVHNRL